jgi:tetratricopeptide (TPR) repeat protein
LLLAPGDRIATLGLARAEAASGHPKASITLLRALTDRFPDPAALTLLGDLLKVGGDTKAADDSYALVEAIAGLSRANSQIYNRELVYFYANHDRRLSDALRLARAEIVTRKDVQGYDALAWAEFKTGHLDLAEVAATKALALGTPDASTNYHAGMIAAARGEKSKARTLLTRALKLSPLFDVLHAPLARTALDRLAS